MFKVVVKFKTVSNWRNHVRQFETIEAAEAFLDDKWNVWPVSCAWVFRDDVFFTKYIFSPAKSKSIAAGCAREKQRQYNLYRCRSVF